MTDETKKYLGPAVVVVVALALFFGYKWYGQYALWSIPSRSSVADKPELAAAYDRAAAGIAKLRSGEEDARVPRPYIDVAQDLKMIGDFTHDNAWHRAALRIFERAIEGTGEKNSLLIDNAGQMAMVLGDYKKAAGFYQQAIELAPGDATYYIHLVNALVKMNASHAEIVAVFDEGSRRIVGGADLVMRRSAYYKSVGMLDKAREDIELLYQAGILQQASYEAALRELQERTTAP